MNIEHAIQQPKFRNQFQKASINIMFSASWLQERIKNVLEPYEITLQQFNILRILRGSQHPISTLQIRERMLDKMSDTSRMVDRLIAKELATKKTSAQDKRLVDVSITAKGLALLAAIDLHESELDNIVTKLTEEEASLLNTLLDKMRSE